MQEAGRKKLHNKVAVVTGAGSGIGAATAKLFAEEGAKVAIVDINPIGKEVSRAIKRAGGESIFVQADVTKTKLVRRMVENTIKIYGKIDILHNHAGILVTGNVISLKESDWDRCMATNLKSVFLVSKYAVPHMIERGGGVILNTASSAGFSPGIGYAAYSASKAAIVLLTKCMALDFAPMKIRVNCICPGPTDTPLFMPKDPKKNKKQKSMWARALPIGRIGNPNDIAYAALYLVSDEAAFVTGTALLIDGGRTLVGIGNRIARSETQTRS